MNNLYPIEAAALSRLLSGEGETAVRLRRQLEKARIIGREFTGSGFFVDFDVDPALALPGAVSLTLDNAHADVPGLDGGLGFLLFVRQGLVRTLEGFTYGDQYDHHPKLFEMTERNASNE
jgi:hypothetical protein